MLGETMLAVTRRIAIRASEFTASKVIGFIGQLKKGQKPLFITDYDSLNGKL